MFLSFLLCNLLYFSHFIYCYLTVFLCVSVYVFLYIVFLLSVYTTHRPAFPRFFYGVEGLYSYAICYTYTLRCAFLFLFSCVKLFTSCYILLFCAVLRCFMFCVLLYMLCSLFRCVSLFALAWICNNAIRIIKQSAHTNTLYSISNCTTCYPLRVVFCFSCISLFFCLFRFEGFISIL